MAMIYIVKEKKWFRVYFVDELPMCPCCFDEALCIKCDMHYGECECPGPEQVIDSDEYEHEFRENGTLWARESGTA